jgi:hypothetical protein
MDDPMAVDENWITAFLSQDYHRHWQPPSFLALDDVALYASVPFFFDARLWRDSIRMSELN